MISLIESARCYHGIAAFYSARRELGFDLFSDLG
jgi:hypothetical protein